jgi:hypothetical protein
MHREADLLELVGARHAPPRRPGRLNRRQQEPDQDPDDRDHDQEFNESEAATVVGR